ncbi:hypothetical protein [Bythopirellula polymerisocia]|uniref:ABC-2 family transporter protein n=1 Tax=Bythopirellula polymerisocia TaxID=2528003 RepID=A0A5C6CXZ9_9BACT|nr:hypothetical protein [Bythopirellula polymerisocia]TWU29440.1 hypothetical protein Pla144_02180 [Bythopirellula polymerisocia]
MSSLALAETTRPPDKAQLNKALWVRFAWKEYRMLRGFWLAILVLGAVGQWVSTLMMINDYLIPSWLFSSAWGAAALYAVGAAVTLFGAENEERTRGFLQLLPGLWQPIFFAKLAVAVGSAVLLAGVLCLTGWMIAGFVWPAAEQCILSLTVAGVAIVEATVWGLLFSLLWKQPLMAAVAAMAVASFGSQLAVLATPLARDSFSAESYQAAIPMRLAICLVVFVVDVLIGSQWLAPLGLVGKRRKEASSEFSLVTAKSQAAVKSEFQPWRRRMFVRLLWQTWRESRVAILTATGLGLLLTVSCFIPATLLGQGGSSPPWQIFFLLILPALFGALVFRGDQKRNHRLFLATHSARPRLVWLARQIVWLGALLIVLHVIRFSFWRIIPMETARQIASSLAEFGSNFEFRGDYYKVSEWLQRWWHGQVIGANRRMALGAWSAVLAAYSLGQFFSLTFKREVLAGFLAILFSVLLAAWSLVVFVWQLNPLAFVLPLAVASLAATLLRMPYWLVERGSLRYWLLPALSLGLPLLFISLYLPLARLRQIDLPMPRFRFQQAPFEATLKIYEQGQLDRQESIVRFERIAGIAEEELEAESIRMQSFAEITVDGKTFEEFGISPTEVEEYSFGSKKSLEPSVRKTLNRFEHKKRESYQAFKEAHLAIVVEKLQEVEFPVPLYNAKKQNRNLPSANLLLNLVEDVERRMEANELEDAWIRLQFVLSIDSEDFLERKWFENKLRDWASHPQQTSERIKFAVAGLESIFSALPHPQDYILQDYLKTRDVILEKQLPQYLNDRNSQYFAFLANKFPWESERALQALDYFARQALNYCDAVVTLPNGMSTGADVTPRSIRDLLLKAPYSKLFAINRGVFEDDWQEFARACNLTYVGYTSFLAAKEFGNSGDFHHLLNDWAIAETKRRALLIELALLAYRLDHREYPEKLAELVPEYLAKMQLDPYSGEDFQYRPEGLKHPLLYHADESTVLSELPAESPLFWSVGIFDCRLEKLSNYADLSSYYEKEFGMSGGYGGDGSYGEVNVEEPENIEPLPEGHIVYQFRGKNSEEYNPHNLVFPLSRKQAEQNP